MGRRLLALTVSLALMGVCIAIFKIVGFGTDPSATFITGLSLLTGLSFGTCMLLLNLALFLIVLRYDLSRIGVGTVMNMAGVGYMADFTLYLLRPVVLEGGLPIGVRLAVFGGTMALFLTVAAFYLAADLGVAPSDAIPQLIAARVKKPSYRGVRMIWDLSLLTAGFLLGAEVGLTTLLTGFCLGPAIAFVSSHVEGWFGESRSRV